jgi:class 3 adenylate cyclase/tetratricopeptide (TPR) repeat protein/energy-coupling factor transporter ATP-binding protein EcfA2
MSGERRVVTMLFCDVRGSTSMAEELDPEEWTDVMNAAYEHLIAPVYRYEGTVARLMGDAILAFFGAPAAHEDDPQRAVAAGLEIVSSIGPLRERLTRERGFDLNVRVGINTGTVVVGDVGSELRQEYSAMGDAVNVAARMEQTAEPGTVQITEDTYRLVADLFDVEPLGEVELKGKRRPVPAYRVLGRLAGRWKVRAASPLEAPLVGRDPEMGVVRAAIEDVQRGRGSILLITGDPGMGKSRLVEEANGLWTQLNPGDDRRWDFWHCVPYDAMQPYAQYRRLIRERAGIVEADPADMVRTKIADLMRLAPQGWGERSERLAWALLGVELEGEPRLEGEAFQREATEVLVGSTLAQGGRRLIVFEDLHWCDHASLELVRETTRLVEEAPIVFLITFRPDPVAVSWGFREWVESELRHRSTLIELEPLSNEQSDELIDELLPVEQMPGDVRKRIFAKTEGNPLFVQEVARALIDRGVVERTDAGWRLAGDVAEVAIPDTVQSLITVGLDRLPQGARRTLQAAAVIGRSFGEDVLLAVAVGDDVLEDLRELERHDLIRPTDSAARTEYTFRHALTHEAAYGSLLVKRRRAVHRRVAEALEAANAERIEEVAPLLARHFGEAGEDEAALRYAVVAGDAAARLYANAEAEAHYRTGLDLARRIGAETSLLRSLFERRGNTLELEGRYDDAIVNYKEMHSEAQAIGDETMELAANTAIAVLFSTATPKFDPERGRRLSEQNVATARRLGDRAAEARALWNIVVANVYGGGDAPRAVEAGEASLAIARELGDRAQLAFTLNDVCRAYMANGDFPLAAQRLEEARPLWEELGNLPMLGENLALGSSMSLFDGDHAAALSDARSAYSIAESIDNAWGQSHALISVYRTELDAGDFGVAIGSIHRCLELGERGGFAFAAIVTRADLARIFAYLGDGERALPLADRALELAGEQVPTAASLGQIARADALIAIGDHPAARAALEEVEVELLPEPDRTFSLVASRLAGSRLAVAAGDPQEAAAHAGAVIGHLRRNGVRVLVAEAIVAVARARIAQGRFEEAESELAEALEEAERLGERTVLWEILALSAEMRAHRGAADEAAELRRRARVVVEEIAAGISDEALRSRFLARDDVVALDFVEP